jgi:putative FmdB family regulatory protein
VPTYEYRCKECGDETEVVQSFTDDALTTCTVCSGPLRKLFGNVGIAFKGSGFYKNDSRGKSTAGTAEKNGSDKSSADAGTGGAEKASSGDAGSTSKGDAGSGKKKEPVAASSGAASKPDAPKSSSKDA